MFVLSTSNIYPVCAVGIKRLALLSFVQSHQLQQTRSSAIAETARVTIRSVIAVDQLTLTITLNMTCVNFISLIEMSTRRILDPVCHAS